MTPPSLTAAEREGVRKFIEWKTREVSEHIDKGRFEEAEKLAKALLVVAPDAGGNVGLLKSLKNEARDGLQSRSVVGGEIRVPEDFLEVGDRVVVRVVLLNRSGAPLEVDMGDAGEGRGAATIRVAFEERGVLGGVRMDAWAVPLGGLRGTRVVEPGGSWETELVIDSADRSPFNPTVRIYRLSGEIWPRAMTLGARPLMRPIRLAEVVMTVYPRGLGPMRAAPFETMKEGVEEEFAPKVVLAAAFIPDERYREAVTLLVEGQERDLDNPAMRRAMRVALRSVTGRTDLPLEGDPWRRWWGKHGQDVLQGRKAGADGGGEPWGDGTPPDKESGRRDAHKGGS
ncbi:MAG: hypothetical protein ACYS47_09605 [Planctomycetota bacterium]